MFRRTIYLSIFLILASTMLWALEGIQAYSSNEAFVQQSPIGYDFETGTEGWVSRNGAIAKPEQAESTAKSGQYSLKLPLDLKPANHSGETWVSLDTPIDLTGKTISAWIYAPLGIRGEPTQPNSLHLFVADRQGRKLYGTSTNFLEGGWFQVTLSVAQTVSACGSIDTGFDPTKIKRIGLNIASPKSSKAVFAGNIYLDLVNLGVVSPLQSAYFFDFQGTTAINTYPKWDIPQGWNAPGLSNPKVSNGVLSMVAHFATDSTEGHKGVVGVVYSPPIDLTHKDNTIISADIRFNPTAIQKKGDCPFVASIWAYDDVKKKWFISDDINVGTSEWTRMSFDVADMVQYKPGSQDYPTDTPTLDAIRQIVIQFWANTPYDGQLEIDNIAIGGQEVQHPNVNKGIVESKSGHFTLNGQSFRYVGANAEYLSVERSSTVAEVLDQAMATGIKVVRVWGFGEGCENKNIDNCEQWSRRFQPRPGQWNEATFQHFDKIVAMAAERGIRLIVTFANNWQDYGGRQQYVEWLKTKYPDDIKPGLDQDAYLDLFYNNPHIRQWYKDYVRYFLSRTNSVTGLRYTQDPTIFAWELINEPRAKSDQTGATLHNWIVEMSDFVESLDPNHMIGTGEEGWYIMPKEDVDKRIYLDNGSPWQPADNYWQYGVNQKTTVDAPATANGVDFISDHSSQDTEVCWQDYYISKSQQGEKHCDKRKGVPNIDFASIHLYIDPQAANLYHAPYCDMKFSQPLCDTYDTQYNQVLLWIGQHVDDAKSLDKPLLVSEFGFHRIDPFGAYSSGGVPTSVPVDVVPVDWIPVTNPMNMPSIQLPATTSPTDPDDQGKIMLQPFERAKLLKWYLQGMASSGVDGALFWDLGFDGFAESPWDDARIHTLSEPSTWQANPQTDVAEARPCLGPLPSKDRYSICVNYDSTKGKHGAFINKPTILGSDNNWVQHKRLRFDIYSDLPAFVIVRLIAGANDTRYESVPIPVTSGWNTVTVDTSRPAWRSSSTQLQYGTVVSRDDRINIRQVSIGLVGYETPGIFYVNNVRFVYDDSLAILAGDPALEAIKEAIYQYWEN